MLNLQQALNQAGTYMFSQPVKPTAKIKTLVLSRQVFQAKTIISISNQSYTFISNRTGMSAHFLSY